MNPVSPKVTVGATSGASVGTGASLVLLWVLGQWHVNMPPEVAIVVASWLTAGVGFLGGWLQREVNLPPTIIPPPVAIVPPPAQGANP